MSVGTQEEAKSLDGFISLDISEEYKHAFQVSSLAYHVAREMGLEDGICSELMVAGVLHDIGKLMLVDHIYGDGDHVPFIIEELKYMRMHSTLAYEELLDKGYSDNILKSILYHHENYDGSGYPANLRGEKIPLGARILRVCDVYSALRSDRPYRKARDMDTAMRLMIDEVRFFDMQVFLAFQRVVHKWEWREIKG